MGPRVGGGGDGHVGVGVVVGGALPVCRDVWVDVGPGELLHCPGQRGPRPLQPPGRVRTRGQGALGAAEDGALQLLLEAGVRVTQVAREANLGCCFSLEGFGGGGGLGSPDWFIFGG